MKRQQNLSKQEPLQGVTETEKEIIRATCRSMVFGKINQEKQEGLLRAEILKNCVLLGIKNPPSASMNFILDFFRKYYNKITLAEFSLAIEMNLLDLFPKRVEHFQDFNLDFISAVMNYYSTSKREAIQNYHRAQPQAKEVEEHKTTPKEWYDSLVSFVKKNKELPFGFRWEAVYDYMEAEGMVKETDEELKKFREEVKQQVKTQAQLKKLKAADSIERMRIEVEFGPTSLPGIYKTEYVKRKMLNLLK